MRTEVYAPRWDLQLSGPVDNSIFSILTGVVGFPFLVWSSDHADQTRTPLSQFEDARALLLKHALVASSR